MRCLISSSAGLILGMLLTAAPPALSEPLAESGGAIRLTKKIIGTTPGPGRA